MPFVVLYDANALYGNAQRDLLIRIARAGLVQAKWTDEILTEMAQARLRRNPDLPRAGRAPLPADAGGRRRLPGHWLRRLD